MFFVFLMFDVVRLQSCLVAGHQIMHARPNWCAGTIVLFEDAMLKILTEVLILKQVMLKKEKEKINNQKESKFNFKEYGEKKKGS